MHSDLSHLILQVLIMSLEGIEPSITFFDEQKTSAILYGHEILDR